jgi:signal transduction histidine kinase
MIADNENNSTRWSGNAYLVTGVILSLLVWIVSYNFAEREKEQRFNDAAEQASQTAVFFERHVVGIFQYGDAYLKLVRWEYVENYDLAEIEQLMAEIPLNKSIASHITIIDETGTPILVSGYQIKPGTTAKDRDYFKIQKNADGDELLVSRLHKGRNSGKQIIRLVRRFEKSNGEFGGVIFLALEADHITEFFNTMQIGPTSSATLVGEDKFVRSRSSYGPKGPGQDISGSQIWQRLEESPVGLYLQTSVVDDITRYYAYRKVPDLPLIVAIGLSVDDFEQAIAVARLNHYAIALLATLLIALTVLFFYRQQESRKQIEAKNSELQNQNAELERFNYTVSHDLKAPLVTIKGFLGLLQKDLSAEKQEAVANDIGQINTAANKMGQLLDELLELSKIGRQMNAPEVRDLDSLVREAVERVAMQIEDQDVDLQIAPDMPQVYGDPGRLLEVFQNLIDNSTKFMGEQKHPCVEIGAQLENGQVHCFVRDNGVGIAPDYHARVFDLFDRLDTRVDGTGIGLALVKRIVEVHGGRIWIESAGPGQGSTFHFTLPAAP